jgi:hypothetical protein
MNGNADKKSVARQKILIHHFSGQQQTEVLISVCIE